MARLFRVLLPVTNINAAQAFYEKVLGTAGRRVSPGRHYFDCGGTILACFDPEADGDGYSATALTEPLYLSVPDLESTFKACESAGATFSQVTASDIGPLGAIAKRPWGELSFYLEDPFGNPLCFVADDTIFTG